MPGLTTRLNFPQAQALQILVDSEFELNLESAEDREVVCQFLLEQLTEKAGKKSSLTIDQASNAAKAVLASKLTAAHKDWKEDQVASKAGELVNVLYGDIQSLGRAVTQLQAVQNADKDAKHEQDSWYLTYAKQRPDPENPIYINNENGEKVKAKEIPSSHWKPAEMAKHILNLITKAVKLEQLKIEFGKQAGNEKDLNPGADAKQEPSIAELLASKDKNHPEVQLEIHIKRHESALQKIKQRVEQEAAAKAAAAAAAAVPAPVAPAKVAPAVPAPIVPANNAAAPKPVVAANPAAALDRKAEVALKKPAIDPANCIHFEIKKSSTTTSAFDTLQIKFKANSRDFTLSYRDATRYLRKEFPTSISLLDGDNHLQPRARNVDAKEDILEISLLHPYVLGKSIEHVIGLNYKLIQQLNIDDARKGQLKAAVLQWAKDPLNDIQVDPSELSVTQRIQALVKLAYRYHRAADREDSKGVIENSENIKTTSADYLYRMAANILLLKPQGSWADSDYRAQEYLVEELSSQTVERRLIRVQILGRYAQERLLQAERIQLAGDTAAANALRLEMAEKTLHKAYQTLFKRDSDITLEQEMTNYQLPGYFRGKDIAIVYAAKKKFDVRHTAIAVTLLESILDCYKKMPQNAEPKHQAMIKLYQDHYQQFSQRLKELRGENISVEDDAKAEKNPAVQPAPAANAPSTLLQCFERLAQIDLTSAETQHITREIEKSFNVSLIDNKAENPPAKDDVKDEKKKVPDAVKLPAVLSDEAVARRIKTLLNQKDSNGHTVFHKISSATVSSPLLGLLETLGADRKIIDNNNNLPHHFGLTSEIRTQLTPQVDVNTKMEAWEKPVSYAIFPAVDEKDVKVDASQTPYIDVYFIMPDETCISDRHKNAAAKLLHALAERKILGNDSDIKIYDQFVQHDKKFTAGPQGAQGIAGAVVKGFDKQVGKLVEAKIVVEPHFAPGTPIHGTPKTIRVTAIPLNETNLILVKTIIKDPLIDEKQKTIAFSIDHSVETEAAIRKVSAKIVQEQALVHLKVPYNPANLQLIQSALDSLQLKNEAIDIKKQILYAVNTKNVARLKELLEQNARLPVDAKVDLNTICNNPLNLNPPAIFRHNNFNLDYLSLLNSVVMQGSTPVNDKIVELLLQYGANPNSYPSALACCPDDVSDKSVENLFSPGLEMFKLLLRNPAVKPDPDHWYMSRKVPLSFVLLNTMPDDSNMHKFNQQVVHKDYPLHVKISHTFCKECQAGYSVLESTLHWAATSDKYKHDLPTVEAAILLIQRYHELGLVTEQHHAYIDVIIANMQTGTLFHSETSRLKRKKNEELGKNGKNETKQMEFAQTIIDETLGRLHNKGITEAAIMANAQHPDHADIIKLKKKIRSHEKNWHDLEVEGGYLPQTVSDEAQKTIQRLIAQLVAFKSPQPKPATALDQKGEQKAEQKNDQKANLPAEIKLPTIAKPNTLRAIPALQLDTHLIKHLNVKLGLESKLIETVIEGNVANGIFRLAVIKPLAKDDKDFPLNNPEYDQFISYPISTHGRTFLASSPLADAMNTFTARIRELAELPITPGMQVPEINGKAKHFVNTLHTFTQLHGWKVFEDYVADPKFTSVSGLIPTGSDLLKRLVQRLDWFCALMAKHHLTFDPDLFLQIGMDRELMEEGGAFMKQAEVDVTALLKAKSTPFATFRDLQRRGVAWRHSLRLRRDIEAAGFDFRPMIVKRDRCVNERISTTNPTTKLSTPLEIVGWMPWQNPNETLDNAQLSELDQRKAAKNAQQFSRAIPLTDPTIVAINLLPPLTKTIKFEPAAEAKTELSIARKTLLEKLGKLEIVRLVASDVKDCSYSIVKRKVNDQHVVGLLSNGLAEAGCKMELFIEGLETENSNIQNSNISHVINQLTQHLIKLHATKSLPKFTQPQLVAVNLPGNIKVPVLIGVETPKSIASFSTAGEKIDVITVKVLSELQCSLLQRMGQIGYQAFAEVYELAGMQHISKVIAPVLLPEIMRQAPVVVAPTRVNLNAVAGKPEEITVTALSAKDEKSALVFAEQLKQAVADEKAGKQVADIKVPELDDAYEPPFSMAAENFSFFVKNAPLSNAMATLDAFCRVKTADEKYPLAKQICDLLVLPTELIFWRKAKNFIDTPRPAVFTMCMLAAVQPLGVATRSAPAATGCLPTAVNFVGSGAALPPPPPKDRSIADLEDRLSTYNKQLLQRVQWMLAVCKATGQEFNPEYFLKILAADQKWILHSNALLLQKTDVTQKIMEQNPDRYREFIDSLKYNRPDVPHSYPTKKEIEKAGFNVIPQTYHHDHSVCPDCKVEISSWKSYHNPFFMHDFSKHTPEFRKWAEENGAHFAQIALPGKATFAPPPAPPVQPPSPPPRALVGQFVSPAAGYWRQYAPIAPIAQPAPAVAPVVHTPTSTLDAKAVHEAMDVVKTALTQAKKLLSGNDLEKRCDAASAFFTPLAQNLIIMQIVHDNPKLQTDILAAQEDQATDTDLLAAFTAIQNAIESLQPAPMPMAVAIASSSPVLSGAPNGAVLVTASATPAASPKP